MQLALINQCLLNTELKDQYLKKDLLLSLFPIVSIAACVNALSRIASWQRRVNVVYAESAQKSAWTRMAIQFRARLVCSMYC